MNIRIMKNGVEVGYLENVKIELKTRKDTYKPRHMLNAEVTDNKDVWTVSVLYMLQYLSDDFTYEVY